MRIAIGLCVALAGGLARAQEPPPARCLLRVIHALPGEGGVDEKLAPLKDRLTRPPFVAWKSFRLLSAEERELKASEGADYPLPSGRKVQLVYAEHVEAAGGKHQVRGALKLEGGKSASRTMFSLDEGGLLLLAGERHAGGILIYALSCKTGK